MDSWKNTSSQRYDTISELKNRIGSHLLCGIYTMKYYSAMKKTEIISSAATRTDLEVITSSK